MDGGLLCWSQSGKESAAIRKTRVWFLGQEDPLEEGMTTHSSILAWEIPWTQEPGGLRRIGSRKESDMAEWITLSLHPFPGFSQYSSLGQRPTGQWGPEIPPGSARRAFPSCTAPSSWQLRHLRALRVVLRKCRDGTGRGGASGPFASGTKVPGLEWRRVEVRGSSALSLLVGCPRSRRP